MTFVVPPFDPAALDEVAASLDLRAPNHDAVETVAVRLFDHYAASTTTFEGVLDAATGVGKTYIMAAMIDYFAEMGVRNFAIIAPGQTILQKTIEQFTPGSAKSLLDGMRTQPVLITSDNFNTAAMRAAMEDESQVKLFVFSVQALIKPSTKVGRRTHKFQEGLGTAFYTHLDELDDLMVLADEHHCYYGDSFSKAIRELTPLALIGLTGTPHKKTPVDEIIFRYPLTAAIADELVKTPVIVGRRDDLTDELSQLLDGVSILEAKQSALDKYAEVTEAQRQNAMLLVNCKDIVHAEEIGVLLATDTFFGGRYKDAILVVHSDKSEESLLALDAVEDSASPIRIIVQVGMLKEGWDVKTVYVICSLRASVSDILTEQTMGRGLRLPFGQYTGWDMLDTLDVLAHEQYEKVLAKAGVLNERFIDHRTVLKETTLMDGTKKVVADNEPVVVLVVGDDDDAGLADSGPHIRVTDTERRKKEVVAPPIIRPRADVPEVKVPVVRTLALPGHFSLAQVVDTREYRELGQRLATTPATTLRRTRLSAKRVAGQGGEEATQLATSQAPDAIESQVPAIPLDQARLRIIQTVRQSSVVPARQGEGEQAERLLAEVEAGAGDAAVGVFTRYPERVARDVIGLIIRDQTTLTPAMQRREEAVLSAFQPKARAGKTQTSTDHVGKFNRNTGYTGWSKSLYDEVGFDSSTERAMAVLLDGAAEVTLWVRLARGDLPLLWNGAANQYNPDFLVVDNEDNKWLGEVKADREMASGNVQAKRAEALTWANHVNAAKLGAGVWSYLLVSESDLAAAKGSWPALVAATKA